MKRHLVAIALFAIYGAHADQNILKVELVPYISRQKAPLHMLIRKGQTEMAQLLIKDQKIDLNHKNDRRETPLYTAVSKRNGKLVKGILDQKGRFDINVRNGHSDRTALMQAYLIGENDIFKLLIQAGADVNIVDKMGNTVLHAAAERGRKDDVAYLLKHGAEKNVMNSDGKKPIDIARAKGKRSIVRLL